MFDLIILDLDGTLYSLDDVLVGVYQSQVAFLMTKWGKSEEDVKAYLTENQIYPYLSRESRSATELFIKEGIDIEEWSAWRNNHFDEKNINIELAVEEGVVCRLRRLAPIVLLSSNVSEVIGRILNHIGVSVQLFDAIFCSDSPDMPAPFDKRKAMQYISKRYDILPAHILSIGDRYKTDIVPALQIGANGLLLKRPKYLQNVCEAIEGGQLATCQWFDYYAR